MSSKDSVPVSAVDADSFSTHPSPTHPSPPRPFPAHPASKLSETDLEREEEHFIEIVKALASYRTHSETLLHKYWRDFAALPPVQRELLAAYREKIMVRAAHCTETNQRFCDLVIEPHAHLLSSPPSSGPVKLEPSLSTVMKLEPSSVIAKQVEAENLRSLLRQVMRDWSLLGEDERESCYQPIYGALEAEYPSVKSRQTVAVLVPGAGLGRLAYEISQRGFTCQGNEFSLLMLLTAEFFLGRSGLAPQSLSICPFVLPFSNTVQLEDQFRVVAVPDIAVAPAPADFSMIAGDFLEVYGEEEAAWQAVVTSYFVDTAKNIVDYILCVRRLLVVGGVWINNGPLLYHFEGHATEPSIELSVEELRSLVQQLGFAFERDEFGASTYAQNPASMHQTVYHTWFFVARKQASAA